MIVCVCNAIREDELRAVARKGSPCTVTAFAALDCEPACGCCLDYAQEIIDEERATSPRKSTRVVIDFPRAA